MVSNLSIPELYKYSWRIEAFLIKYRQEQAFELLDGSIVKLLYSQHIEECIYLKEISKLTGYVLSSYDGKKYKLSDLRKTAEFGGKGAGYSTRVETNEISSINQQLFEIKTQTLQITVPLIVGSNVYTITSCTKTPGNPKSDFSFLDENDNEVIWISHKKGNKPQHFQQYSGLMEFKDHPEVSSFVYNISNQFPFGLSPSDCVGRKIDDVELKMKSVYGFDYNINPFNKNNVTALIQGEIKFVKSDNYFTIETNKIHSNGEILDEIYDPIMIGRYGNDRHQLNIQHLRCMIIPKEGRKINGWL